MNNNLSFKEWLSANEATTTSSIATFSRPVGMIRRKFADTIATNKDKFKGAIDCAKDPKACIKPTVDKTVDCVKDPKSCVKKGVGVVKGMHKDLGGGVKGAAALAGIGATAAIVPGGGIVTPLLYKGAKKLLNPKQNT